jgi:hypothetical protein
VQFEVTQFQTYTFNKAKQKVLENSSLVGMKAQRDEDERRALRGGHAAADELPVCWSLDFHWTPSYIYIYI